MMPPLTLGVPDQMRLPVQVSVAEGHPDVDVDVELACALWRKGFNVQEIATRLRTSPYAVADILQHRPRDRVQGYPVRHHTCPWCRADIRGTTPDAPHVCR